MKTVYCIEQWWKEDDDHFRDGSFWGLPEDWWKLGHFPVLYEFDDEEEFRKELKRIIDGCGIIGKVYHKEMPDDYNPSMKIL